MNISGKWILRVGALFIVLGFILPAFTVSCSGMPGFGQTFTLAQITSEAKQPLLYLVPIGALIAGILSFYQSESHAQNIRLFFAQVIFMALGLVSMGYSYLSISNQVQQTGGFEMSPEFGFFILLCGYLGSAVGFWFEWQERQHDRYVSERTPKQPHSPPPEKIPKEQPQREVSKSPGLPYLEPIQGNLAREPVYIQGDIFLIGRGSDNHLQLHDSKVSREHARIRYAQGSWFIQDQGSSHGTHVNNHNVQAQRLETGDKIAIGETTLVFYRT